MRIFNELRYPSSNLSEIFTQRMFQASFEKIWKIFFELSRGQAWSYGRTDRQTDRQTDGQTDRQTDRRTDAGNDNTPPALGPRGNKILFLETKNKFERITFRSAPPAGCGRTTDFPPFHSGWHRSARRYQPIWALCCITVSHVSPVRFIKLCVLCDCCRLLTLFYHCWLPCVAYWLVLLLVQQLCHSLSCKTNISYLNRNRRQAMGNNEVMPMLSQPFI